MKFTAIRQAVATQLGWRKTARQSSKLATYGRALTAGTLVLAGGMVFLAAPQPVHAETDFLLNGSFESNDGFNGNNVGFSWISGNAGGNVNTSPDPDEPAVFDVYDHVSQQYGGFDPDTFLGGDTAGSVYFHTVGVNGLALDGTTVEDPIVRQNVDISSRPVTEPFFGLSGILSGFGTDTAKVEVSFWNAAGGIDGAGGQIGTVFTIDGNQAPSSLANLDGNGWTSNGWSEYIVGGSVPTGAVSATVQIFQNTVSDGNGNDNYVDLLRLFTSDVEPVPSAETLLKIVINRDNGEIFLQNNTTGAQDIQGYSITSVAGTLLAANWQSIDDNYDIDQSGAVAGAEWVEFSAPNAANDLSEGALGTGTLAQGANLSLGNAWQQYFAETDDIGFEYLDGNGDSNAGAIQFVGIAQTTPFVEGDINFDGAVDGLDWAAYVANLGNTFAAQSDAAAYANGDFDNDGSNDHADFLTFKGLFEAANPLLSFEAMIAGVPEPTSVALAMFGIVGIAGFGNRRRA